jgi:prophage DNA circulation protein
MADWRDSLLPGSIGGVSLFISEVKSAVGRRTTSRELPFRDTPAHEDLGRRARRFSVSGFVIGVDYIAQRDAVIAVFESKGPWLFVHPWWGELSIVLDEGSSLDVAESDAEGGWARFSFSLVESGEADGAKITISTSAALSVASKTSITAVQVDTLNKMKLDIGSVFSAAAAAVGKISSAMLAAKRKVQGALGVSQAAGLSDSLADLKANANKLLNTPAELLTTLNGLVSSMKSIFSDFATSNAESPNAAYPGGSKKLAAEAAISMAQELAAVDTVTPPPYPGGPQDEDAVAAERALSKVLGVMVVSQTIDLFGSSLPVESAQAAVEALTTLGELADEILLDTETSDDLFTSMSDLRAALDSHLASLSSSLPTVEKYIPPASMPALLLAFQIYGDPTRDLEIVGRNNIADPNFLPGGEPVELLINA